MHSLAWLVAALPQSQLTSEFCLKDSLCKFLIAQGYTFPISVWQLPSHAFCLFLVFFLEVRTPLRDFVAFCRGMSWGCRGVVVGCRGLSWGCRGLSWVVVGLSWGCRGVVVGLSWVVVGEFVGCRAFSWLCPRIFQGHRLPKPFSARKLKKMTFPTGFCPGLHSHGQHSMPDWNFCKRGHETLCFWKLSAFGQGQVECSHFKQVAHASQSWIHKGCSMAARAFLMQSQHEARIQPSAIGRGC